MNEPSWEDLKRIKLKRESEIKDYTEVVKTRSKQSTKKHKLNPTLETLLRLWSIRNKDFFKAKELQIFPDDKIETLYIQVHKWVEAGYLESIIGGGYCVTPIMKQRLEGAFIFMLTYKHGQGIQ